MNAARLQRAIFRMQHDSGFAWRILAGDPEALRSASLTPAELGALRAVPAAAFGADRDGKRSRQFLGNVSSEFRACRALGPRGDGDQAWLRCFAESPEFHRCAAENGRFPLAFRDYAERIGQEEGTAAFRALAALEGEMAHARRFAVTRPVPGPDEAALAAWARVVELPAGTHALASALQEDLPERPTLRGGTGEAILMAASAATPPPGGLRVLRVETLAPLVAAFLSAADRPVPIRSWRGFAARHDLAYAEVAAVAQGFVDEGVLVIGA